MKPSDFKVHPFNSVTQNCESETVARNIMVILARTGDTFRKLPWAKYKKERMKDADSDAVDMEKSYFDVVQKFCLSAETAACFSPSWNKRGASRAR